MTGYPTGLPRNWVRDVDRDDEVQGILRGLLVLLPSLPARELDFIEQFISADEYALAVEVLMDTVEVVGVPLSEVQRVALAEAGRMVRVGPDYEHWLSAT